MDVVGEHRGAEDDDDVVAAGLLGQFAALGGEEAGEGPLHGSIPALSNAVFDAVGIRLKQLPFTPAAVRKALRELERAPKKPVKS